MYRLIVRASVGWVLVSLLFTGSAAAAETWAIDAAASRVHWLGKKMTGQHEGHVPVRAGEVVFEGGKLVGGKLDIDMANLTCADLKDAKYNKKLVGHLKSDDFFSTAKFPMATFDMIKVTAGATGAYDVEANVTIKGITHPVNFTMNVSSEGKSYVGVAKLTLDRTLWNVRYRSGKFFKDLGDKLIYDDFEIDFRIVAFK